jgi:uncharacterized protein YfaS (alpha-2-macroglobulin family)
MFSVIVVVCLVCLLAVQSKAQTFLKVSEAEMRAVVQANRLQTNLVLENQAQGFAGKVRLEILDADDQILAASETTHAIKSGRQTLQIPLAFMPAQAANLPWYRLRYAVTQENSSLSTGGIVSLSEIMPELFELQISASENVFAGMRLRAHVLAFHPLTKKIIKNVDVTGEISLDLETKKDEDKLKIVAKGRTGDEGFATLDFEIPPNVRFRWFGKIVVKGEKNGLTRQADRNLDISEEARVYLNLDKPIYQPNQKLFARGLYLNPARRPLAERELDFEILDEEDETVYEETVKTSRFGVANINWQIPASLKLGKYRIEVKIDGDRIGKSEFKVTRYDLPNFSVSVKPDRSFYLPDRKSAEITVSAGYLFGKPVAAGKVRIAQESERQWNYREQKWEISEAKSYEGATDAEGKFVAAVDLTEAQESLRANAEMAFEDLHFAAYFTDSTTNRTELKRFDVRISKEAIHVYFIHSGLATNPKLPYQFYVSTFYADGSAARCDVEVRGSYPQVQSEKILAETKTNSYGAGKMEIRIPEKPFPEAENRFNLQLSARDKQGIAGTNDINFSLDEKAKQIRVKTDKTIYLPNENIEAKIHSSENNETVFVDVLKNSSVIYSKRVKLGDGRAALQIPFNPDFKGELTIAAYFKSGANYGETISHSKTVIYPAPSDLKVNIKSLKNVYRPNEEAKIAFNVRSAAGVAAETALGVVVLDKAIEERAQTERMPDNYSDLRRLSGTADAFGNLTRRDLNNLDLNKPIDADLQLAAEFLLVNKSYEPRFFESDSYGQNFGGIFRTYFADKLQPFAGALKAHYEKTTEYPKDENTLRRILSANGINFDEMRDAWGMPYGVEFKADYSYVTITLKTASADKKIGTEDDFVVFQKRYEWFTKTQNELTAILNSYIQQTGKKPQTIDELKAVWKQAGVDVDAFRDGWNRPLYMSAVKYTRSLQKPFLENIGNLDGVIQQVLRVKPISQEVVLFKLYSAGEDATKDSFDDFYLGTFSIVLSEKDLSEQMPAGKISKSKTNAASGAITGTLFDQMGAVIPNIKVTAANQSSAETFSVTTNVDGDYFFTNLPPGKYKITADGSSFGFAPTTVENVVVSSMNLIKLDIYLYASAPGATVDVVSGADSMMDSTQNSYTAATVVTKSVPTSISGLLGAGGDKQISTPRVREYFPETLLWQPELITDKNGRAELKFTLADNLTTWKLYAFGSTEAGEVGLAEKDLQTFQPFFAELEPPRILTEGDEIALPVPVRNYTDKRQKVSVSMTENDWSNLLNGATQQIEIAPDTSQNAIFNFRAAAPVREGRQKVTVLAKGEGDAIEKPVTVKPNGKEIIQIQSQVFRENADFEVSFPANAFANTRRAELRVYPNMLAHVAESVEGLLKRPYGCGEQTTSSTYPNLLILKIEKDSGRAVAEKTKMQAEIYLQQGYERLLSYQTPGGGFSYWGRNDTPNVALTAYVLRFLSDARDFIKIDEKVFAGAQNWLLKQQQADGSWQMSYVNTDSSTAYVARSLSMSAPPSEETKKALRAGLEFLKKRLPEIKDAYALANFALASVSAGDAETAAAVAEKLNSELQNDKESFFWTTANTLFYGWGTPAKIETTALVMQVFLRLNENNKFTANLARGLSFLLKNKDEHGVWYSTQTTVNVLDTLLLLQKSAKDAKPNTGEKTEIYINGKKIQDFNVDINALSNPILIDASTYLTEAANRIEIKNGAGSAMIQAQLVAVHYIPWKDALPEASPYFDLKVSFDKTEAKIGDQINCAVSVQRKTNRFGMLLAEIGIPPGADVDRGSLENAKKLDENISRYDILPDRIIVYFWSSPGRTTAFNFKFKPRYGISAQTAPSMVYDYYNEEAKATLAPVRFSVK